MQCFVALTMSKTQSPLLRIPQPIFGIKTEERNNGKSQEAKIPEGPEEVGAGGGLKEYSQNRELNCRLVNLQV